MSVGLWPGGPGPLLPIVITGPGGPLAPVPTYYWALRPNNVFYYIGREANIIHRYGPGGPYLTAVVQSTTS